MRAVRVKVNICWLIENGVNVLWTGKQKEKIENQVNPRYYLEDMSTGRHGKA